MPRHAVSKFLLLVVALSLPFYLLLNLAGGAGAGMRLFVTGLMWCPALAALIVLRRQADRTSALGLLTCGTRDLAWAYLIPFAYGIGIYTLAWCFGLGRFAPEQYLAMNERAIGLVAWPDAARIGVLLLLQVSAGFMLSLATALGEEIGWRGFLAPRLVDRFGFVGGSFAVGVIWAAWHVPVLFLMNYYAETPRWFAVICFTTSMVGMSFVYSWLRLRSGSVWPAAVLHASHNATFTLVFSAMTADSGQTAWAIDEFGYLLAGASIVMAVLVVRFGNVGSSTTPAS